MKAEYALFNLDLYEKNYGKDSEELQKIMDVLSTECIRNYRNNINKFESVQEKKILDKMIEFFEKKELYLRSAQLVKIKEGEPLGNLPVIVE